MKVLVTGAAGYIGSHACLALKDAGHTVVGVDCNQAAATNVSISIGVQMFDIDVCVEREVAPLLSTFKFDAVMHFAGSIDIAESIADPVAYYQNNVGGTLNLLRAMRDTGTKKLIFSSTAAVYGDVRSPRVSEADPTTPISPYGRSKLMVEAILHDAAVAHDLQYAALRYFNVAGADPKGRVGQDPKGKTSLITAALDAATGRREYLTLYGGREFKTHDGSPVRDFIHVSDLVGIHVGMLELMALTPGCANVVNCGYGQGASVLEVIRAVEHVTGNKVPVRGASRRPGEADKVVADTTLLTSLGLAPPPRPVREIVADHYDWYRRQFY